MMSVVMHRNLFIFYHFFNSINLKNYLINQDLNKIIFFWYIFINYLNFNIILSSNKDKSILAILPSL